MLIMNQKKMFLALAIAVLAVLFAGNAFALAQCPNEISYTLGEEKFRGIENEGGALTSNIINYIYQETTQNCGMNKGQSIIINAKYPVKTSDNKAQAITTPLLKITMIKHYADVLASSFGQDNDAWDFQFDLIKPDGSIIKSEKQEIWEYSGQADRLGHTRLDIKTENGEIVFHVALTMDSDAAWDGQLDKLFVESKYEIFDLMKKLAGQQSTATMCPSKGCAAESAATVTDCPNEENFVFKEGGFFGINNEAAYTNSHNALNKIIYGNNGNGCFMKIGQSITINAVYNVLSPQNFGQQVKTPLLKITMLKHNIDKLNLNTDNDTWDFNFFLLKPDGTKIRGNNLWEIWEYSIAAENELEGKTGLNKTLNGKLAFYIGLNMDSDAFNDGQADKLYVEAKQDIFELMKQLAEAPVAAPENGFSIVSVNGQNWTSTTNKQKFSLPGTTDKIEIAFKNLGDRGISGFLGSSRINGQFFLAPSDPQISKENGKITFTKLLNSDAVSAFSKESIGISLDLTPAQFDKSGVLGQESGSEKKTIEIDFPEPQASSIFDAIKKMDKKFLNGLGTS